MYFLIGHLFTIAGASISQWTLKILHNLPQFCICIKTCFFDDRNIQLKRSSLIFKFMLIPSLIVIFLNLRFPQKFTQWENLSKIISNKKSLNTYPNHASSRCQSWSSAGHSASPLSACRANWSAKYSTCNSFNNRKKFSFIRRLTILSYF